MSQFYCLFFAYSFRRHEVMTSDWLFEHWWRNGLREMTSEFEITSCTLFMYFPALPALFFGVQSNLEKDIWTTFSKFLGPSLPFSAYGIHQRASCYSGVFQSDCIHGGLWKNHLLVAMTVRFEWLRLWNKEKKKIKIILDISKKKAFQ